MGLLLPKSAEPLIEAALFDLRTLNAPISVAYRRFRCALLHAQIEPPSLSSFRRWALQQRQRSMVVKRRPAFQAGEAVMAKLVRTAGEKAGVATMLEIALSQLPWRESEATASQLLMSILLHDDLAETLNGCL